jgi:hypothetical protein
LSISQSCTLCSIEDALDRKFFFKSEPAFAALLRTLPIGKKNF